MAEEQRTRPRVRIDRSDLALEIISIVIAIILATAAGQIVDRYRTGERTHEALAQIRREIAQDDQKLRSLRPLHARVREAFGTTLRETLGNQMDFDAMMGTFFRVAPRGFQSFGGTTTAWELARGSTALADVPYGLRAVLQVRYAELANLQMENVALVTRLEGTPTDARPNFFYTTVSVSLILADIVYSENRLVNDDGDALRALDNAGIR